jgi:hypothetical protein
LFYIIYVSQKTFGILLISTMIVIGIATIDNSVNTTLAQFNPNIPFSPSTGQPPSSLSPPSAPSAPSAPPPSAPPPSATNQPVETNPSHAGNGTAPVVNSTAPTGNSTAPVVNSSTIGPPPSPTVVGPSSFTASPITSENQGKLNTSSTSPSNNGSVLGLPDR